MADARAGTTRRPAAEIRRAILDATVRIIGRDGATAVTHRAIAREAGVSLSSTTYHFASTDELVGAALEHVAELEVASAAAGAAEAAASADLADPRRFAELVLDWLEPQLTGEGELTARAGYQLQLEAAHRPELRVLHRDWSRRALGVAEVVLERAGSADPPRDAHILATMIDGLRLEQLTDPQPGFRERAAPLLERLARALRASA